MSGDARISGRIAISPPITWGELHDKLWAIGQDDSYPDVAVELDTTETHTLSGTIKHMAGVAIIPTGHETSAYNLLDEMTRIVEAFRAGPDGTVRAMDGYLHIVWADGEDTYRVHVDRRGDVVEARPEMRWPEGARDEDSVEPRWGR